MHAFYHTYVENFLKLPACDNCVSKKPVTDIVCEHMHEWWNTIPGQACLHDQVIATQ